MTFELEIKGRTLLVLDATFEPAQRFADRSSPADPPELTIHKAAWDDTAGEVALTPDEIDALLDNDDVYTACIDTAEIVHGRWEVP